MSVINTNITSMIGQSNLQKSQNALQTSMERLSSGLRINSAKDDAAGQAIANRMTAQINGLAQAQRNANDGISIAQTAEGSLNQINDNLQRIRELTVQAANGTNSQDDLQSIQDEVNQRLDEIDRISRETDFNGTNVLKEGVEAITIQVGARDNETISVNLTAINRDTLKLDGFQVLDGINTAALGEAVANDETIAGPAVNVTIASDSADPAITAQGLVAYTATDASGDPTGDTLYAVKGSDGNFYAADVSDPSNVTWDSSVAALTIDGDPSSFGFVTDGDTFTTSLPGADVTVSGLEAGQVLRAGEEAGEYVVQQGTGDDAKYFSATVSETGEVTVGRELAVGDKSVNPLEQLDNALNIVDSLRSELGAVQNRFEDAITNLNTNQTNLSAARSRIEDADYAVEVANMTRAQILQQAGTSVLAQANQIPQNVLSLLG